jgi:hypothetical protein
MIFLFRQLIIIQASSNPLYNHFPDFIFGLNSSGQGCLLLRFWCGYFFLAFVLGIMKIVYRA